jgi:hypothetical protein
VPLLLYHNPTSALSPVMPSSSHCKTTTVSLPVSARLCATSICPPLQYSHHKSLRHYCCATSMCLHTASTAPAVLSMSSYHPADSTAVTI